MHWPTILHRFAHRLAIPTAGLSLLTGAVLVGAVPAAAGTISGVCPDGSIFIVQSRSAVPCEEAKQVHPNDIPPLNPELLPMPYGWKQFQDRQNPNNPYNVVDSAPSVRPLGGPRAGGPSDLNRRPDERRRRFVPHSSPSSSESIESGSTERPFERPFQSARVTPSPVYAAARGATNQGAPIFSEQDLRDLAQIVELSQRRAPATFGPREGGSSNEANALTVRIAYSASFEPRLRALFRERGGMPPGDVLLFSVGASEPQPFFGNLTFVQAGVVYHPNRDDVRDLGVLRSELGMVSGREPLLGYARLPEEMDLRREIDIYWNDRLLSAILKPS